MVVPSLVNEYKPRIIYPFDCKMVCISCGGQMIVRAHTTDQNGVVVVIQLTPCLKCSGAIDKLKKGIIEDGKQNNH